MAHRLPTIYIFFGIFVGFSLTVIFLWNLTDPKKSHKIAPMAIVNVQQHSDDDLVHTLDDSKVAEDLYDKVRVLCWILTTPENHKTKGYAVKNTWGKRCNKLLFMSTSEDQELGAIRLPVGEGRQFLWMKTRAALKYIYHHHFHEADWFFKVDDDAYVIVENLRFLLYPYSPKHPIYFGAKYKTVVDQGYMAGGPGYVMSKEAFRRLVEEGLHNPNICPQYRESEDTSVGICMEGLNVEAGDSRDAEKRGRFFPFIPEDHMFPIQNRSYWYWEYIYYEAEEGLNCCSENAVSFHYIEPKNMYVMEYFVYHLSPYGIVKHSQPLPEKILWHDNLSKKTTSNSNASDEN